MCTCGFEKDGTKRFESEVLNSDLRYRCKDFDRQEERGRINSTQESMVFLSLFTEWPMCLVERVTWWKSYPLLV